jgi:hypothetical protein
MFLRHCVATTEDFRLKYTTALSMLELSHDPLAKQLRYILLSSVERLGV